jgi:hypothetical protein
LLLTNGKLAIGDRKAMLWTSVVDTWHVDSARVAIDSIPPCHDIPASS